MGTDNNDQYEDGTVSSAKESGSIRPPDDGRYRYVADDGNDGEEDDGKSAQSAPSEPPSITSNKIPASSQADSNSGGKASSSVPADSMPEIADDTDLIEKEWVDKAKEIVSKTSHDPYMQYQELNKVKNQYIKKRYNKSLKQKPDE